MLETLKNILTIVGAVLSILLGGWAIYDIYLSLKIKGRIYKTLPIKLRKSLRYSQFDIALDRVCRVLDEVRFLPDIIVGIHYKGLSVAALIGKKLYRPVACAKINYSSDGDSHIIKSLSLDFDATEKLKGKKVLIVDNSMITGATLRAVREEINKYTNEILTLVIYDKDRDNPPLITPDITLFASSRPKRLLR